jgi:hypothetical protein
MLISPDEINKLEHMKQLNEDDFRSRITEFEDKKRRKIQQWQDESKDKEVEGCTFKPDLSTTKKEGEFTTKRDLEKFLED